MISSHDTILYSMIGHQVNYKKKIKKVTQDKYGDHILMFSCFFQNHIKFFAKK